MSISDKELDFILKRKRLNRFGFLGTGTSAGVIILVALYLFFKTPDFINPYAFMESFSAGEIENSTVVLMAHLLPLMTFSLFFFLLVMALILMSAVGNERKLLTILDSLQKKA